MIYFFFHALIIACSVWVYQVVLREFLLSEWFLCGYRNLGRDESSWKFYIYKVIFDCEKCLSGQLALWLFFYLSNQYNFYLHIGFIAITIFITRIIFYVETRISNAA